MNESPSKFRVIPLKAMDGAASASAEDLTRVLEREGWIRQSTIGEPRLSEIVRSYERLGYEIRVEANQDAVASGGACSSAASGCSSAAAGGCSSSGCSSASAPQIPVVDDEWAAELRTIFVRKAAWAAN
jgi:hypothetical protein